ncbi:hypothetical protein K469DRAFT_368007 [Zopfia rhizophila CBS 207.26]|uniref:Uncharacterized protein n=1 Tax=Zopfia rhizophila CBS 207.26 TaxID=1314779 RepID=A0A6A6EJT5_9PEZI|nr:hypothetical protein K469DRAFT_368007 [Zopfia rhizophila CBS 207.26]
MLRKMAMLSSKMRYGRTSLPQQRWIRVILKSQRMAVADVFKKARPMRRLENTSHVPKTFLADLGLPKDDAEMTPEIEFWEYLPDSPDSPKGRLAGDGNFVYVIIAMSEPLSTNEGLPEFVRRSHKLQVRSVAEIFRMPTTQITLHIGWALAWTSELSYKLPQGGGGSYALLVYQKRGQSSNFAYSGWLPPSHT